MGLSRASDEGKGRTKIMGKYKVTMMALLAVVALSAVVASGASAHEWLTLAGTAITKTEPATSKGSLALIVKKIPAIEGGGEITVLCDGQFLGTVGPAGVDSIELIENLAGTELNKIDCEVSKSSNGICKGGLVLVTAVGLPWATKLVLSGSTIFDDISATKVGYSVSCSGISNECTVTLELSKFVKNTSTGAEFEFAELEKAGCTIGGEGFVKGKGITEKFLAN
jgi:hypothetical protein